MSIAIFRRKEVRKIRLLETLWRLKTATVLLGYHGDGSPENSRAHLCYQAVKKVLSS